MTQVDGDLFAHSILIADVLMVAGLFGIVTRRDPVAVTLAGRTALLGAALGSVTTFGDAGVSLAVVFLAVGTAIQPLSLAFSERIGSAPSPSPEDSPDANG